MMIEGGISNPSVPAPASVPMVMASGYPRLLSSGSVILPIVAQVADEDPETAANIVQPMMLVCSSRPGTRSSHGARPLNMSSESRVRNRISPIQMNSQRGQRPRRCRTPDRHRHRVARRTRRKKLHPDPCDAGQRDAYPDAAAEQ